MNKTRPSLSLALIAALSQTALAQDDPAFRLAPFDMGEIRSVEAPATVESAPAASPQAGGPEPRLDTTAQFADSSTRNQCDVGSCHAFGSVAVLEAAYNRRHKPEAVRLSEADLFIRRTVVGGHIYKDLCAGKSCKLTEGNDVLGDVQYALDHGVATVVEYGGFVERYRKYRDAEQKTLESMVKNHEKESWLVKLFYDPRTHWAELQAKPHAKKITEMFLAGRDPKIDSERARIKANLEGFRVLEKKFGDPSKSAKLPKEECRKQGAPQGKAALAELRQGRPVTVSMSLGGLAAWGQTDSSAHAYHAFAVVGYTPASKTFQTRNSWGGSNPDVHDHELCRIYSIVTVLAKGEKPAD